jgi:serine/threonine protein kinase
LFFTRFYRNTSQSTGGTPYFSAPECLQRGATITTKADIWSVGAVLYAMTYGTPPMSNNSQPPHGQSRTRSSLIHEIIDRCLQHNVHQRASHHWLAQHPLTRNPSVLG